MEQVASNSAVRIHARINLYTRTHTHGVVTSLCFGILCSCYDNALLRGWMWRRLYNPGNSVHPLFLNRVCITDWNCSAMVSLVEMPFLINFYFFHFISILSYIVYLIHKNINSWSLFKKINRIFHSYFNPWVADNIEYKFINERNIL